MAMQEEVINIENRLVKASFQWPLSEEGKGDLYQIVMESQDLFAVLEHALGLGYVPETFRQTPRDGSNGHLRLKSVKSDNELYARLTSLRQDEIIKYRLYVPHQQQ